MPTVVVKIAVAVDPDGKWNATGWSMRDTSLPAEDDAMDMAVEGLGEGTGEARYWVTAVLHVPEAATVEGEVSSAAKT